jgi:hypothetical protein
MIIGICKRIARNDIVITRNVEIRVSYGVARDSIVMTKKSYSIIGDVDDVIEKGVVG